MKFLASFFISILLLPCFLHAQQGKYFDRVIFVIFENTKYDIALKQPFFKQLADDGALLTNIFAIKHPSQPNYVALTSGSTQGVYSDELVNIDARNIVDLLEEKQISWAVYAEDFPGNCYTGKSKKGYDRKHNPFISYLNIQKNASRCSHIYDAKQFEIDSKNHNLPEYVFFIPNDKHSGHDTNAKYADNWYEKTFSPWIADENFMEETIIITLFDESTYFSNNQIYTSIYGPAIKIGKYGDYLTIYSLLRLVEDNWELGDLKKNDATAPVIPDIWKW